MLKRFLPLALAAFLFICINPPTLAQSSAGTIAATPGLAELLAGASVGAGGAALTAGTGAAIYYGNANGGFDQYTLPGSVMDNVRGFVHGAFCAVSPSSCSPVAPPAPSQTTGSDYSAYGGVRIKYKDGGDSETIAEIKSYTLITVASGGVESIQIKTVNCFGGSPQFHPTIAYRYPGGAWLVDNRSTIQVVSTGVCSPSTAPLAPNAGLSGADVGRALAHPGVKDNIQDAIGGGAVAVPGALAPGASAPLGGAVVSPTGAVTGIAAGGALPTAAEQAAAATAAAAAAAAESAAEAADSLTGEAPGDVAVVAPSAFTKPNFVSYAITQFSDKFPLDLLGEAPALEVSQCPAFTFFGKTHQLCIVNQAFSALKFPVLVAFTIWAILTL